MKEVNTITQRLGFAWGDNEGQEKVEVKIKSEYGQ